jgi:KDO2-lipid IV(A) lauroyltransferase
VDVKGSVIVAAFKLLGLMPLPVVTRAGAMLGRLTWHLARDMRRVTLINLQICFPEMPLKERKRLARVSVIETVMTVCESGAVWTRKPAEITPYITSTQGEELIQQALDSGRGVILIVPHLGNWEIANYHVSSKYPFMAMYAPVPLPALDRLIFNARSQMDAEFVPADRSGVVSLVSFLSKGGLTGVLPDQQPSQKSGVFVPFFNKDALTPVLIAKLLQRTGSLAFGYTCLRNSDNKSFRTVCIPADAEIYSQDDRVSATAMNRTIEQLIRMAPEQYQWEYKRFNKRPSKDEPRPYN